jgi:hypothetical protein
MAEMKEAVKLARSTQNYHTKWKKLKNMALRNQPYLPLYVQDF